MDDRLVGVGVEEAGDRVGQGRPVAAGQVDAADRALEEDVAGEDRVLAASRVGDVAWTVAWGEDHLELEPAERERLAAGERAVGLVALERAEARQQVGVDVGQHRHLDLGAVDRRPGLARQRGDGADVVEVRVGEEDRLDLSPHLRHLGEDSLGLVAGIDDDQLL